MSSSFGEGLSKWSWLQLGGFIILSVGMLMFNGTIPCSVEEEKEEANEALVWSVCCITIPFVVMSEKTHGSRHRSRSRGGEHRHHHHVGVRMIGAIASATTPNGIP